MSKSEEKEYIAEAKAQESDEEYIDDENSGDDSSSEEEMPTRSRAAPSRPPRETASRPPKRRRTDKSVPPAGSFMIPEPLVNFVMTKLQQGDENQVSETLLQLARIFREQAALCLFQAQRLDCLAAGEEPPNVLEAVSSESYSSKLQRRNVECFVNQSADLMLECQEKLDFIESRLVPLNQKVGELFKPKYYRNSFVLYSKENFVAFAERLGTSDFKVVSQEIGKAWKALSKEEKEAYKVRMKELNQMALDATQAGLGVDMNCDGSVNSNG